MALKLISRYRLVLALSISLFGLGCQTVQTTQPGVVGITRTQNMMVSDQQISTASAQAYSKLVKEAGAKSQLNRDAIMNARVQEITRRLIAQTRIFREDASRWHWEVNVLQSDQVNAFCMAGGKIGIYSGIINKLQLTDGELAAVMGHEISHALREHVREQVSLQYATQLPGILLSAVTGIQALGQLGDMVSNVTLGLPRSRQAETEADEMGVELAARAGYDPRAAISLWQKMNRQSGGRQPEFLSTHPSPESREQDLAITSEKVMNLYKAASSR